MLWVRERAWFILPGGRGPFQAERTAAAKAWRGQQCPQPSPWAPVTAEGSPRGTKDLHHRRHQQGLSVTEKEAGEYSLVRAENIFKYIFWMEEAAYRGE